MDDGHLGLGSNVQLGLVDFKVCDWPPDTSLNGQSQTLKSCWQNFKLTESIAENKRIGVY